VFVSFDQKFSTAFLCKGGHVTDVKKLVHREARLWYVPFCTFWCVTLRRYNDARCRDRQ